MPEGKSRARTKQPRASEDTSTPPADMHHKADEYVSTDETIPGDLPRPALSQAKETATELTSKARDALSRQLTERTQRVSADLSRLATALGSTSAQLADHVAGPYIEKLGVGVEGAARFVGELSAAEAIEGAEKLARSKPWLFAGGMIAIGMLGGRVLKGVVNALEANALHEPSRHSSPASP